jgi:hypothetical protein
MPAPDFAANYRGLISAWFETHEHHRDAPPQRGEEGSVGLRFRGRPQLPRFPAGMTASQIEISVTIRFSLTQ